MIPVNTAIQNIRNSRCLFLSFQDRPLPFIFNYQYPFGLYLLSFTFMILLNIIITKNSFFPVCWVVVYFSDFLFRYIKYSETCCWTILHFFYICCAFFIFLVIHWWFPSSRSIFCCLAKDFIEPFQTLLMYTFTWMHFWVLLVILRSFSNVVLCWVEVIKYHCCN